MGIRDYEMAENIDTWINRFAAGINGLRVDAGVYPERLRAAIDAGWHTGKELPGSAGLGHVGAHVAYALAVQGIRRNMQHLKEL